MIIDPRISAQKFFLPEIVESDKIRKILFRDQPMSAYYVRKSRKNHHCAYVLKRMVTRIRREQ